jgi:DNA-binding NarL/FixJ family response regulator
MALSTIPTAHPRHSRPAQVTVALIADQLTRRRVAQRLGARFAPILQTAPPRSAAALDRLLGAAGAAPQVTIVAGGEELDGGEGVIRRLRELLPGSAIVLLSPVEERSLIRRALRAGAAAVLAEADVDELLELTLEAVLAGQLCLPRSLTRRIDTTKLSVRERQVLELISQGLTNGEMAKRLFLSESTVKSHLASSFRKLGVSSRAEAGAMVQESEELAGAAPEQLEQELMRLSAQPAPSGRGPSAPADPTAYGPQRCGRARRRSAA